MVPDVLSNQWVTFVCTLNFLKIRAQIGYFIIGSHYLFFVGPGNRFSVKPLAFPTCQMYGSFLEASGRLDVQKREVSTLSP